MSDSCEQWFKASGTLEGLDHAFQVKCILSADHPGCHLGFNEQGDAVEWATEKKQSIFGEYTEITYSHTYRKKQ